MKNEPENLAKGADLGSRKSFESLDARSAQENGSSAGPLLEMEMGPFYEEGDGSLLANRTLPYSAAFCVAKKAHIYCPFPMCMDRKTRKKAAVVVVSKRHFAPSKKREEERRSNDIGYTEKRFVPRGTERRPLGPLRDVHHPFANAICLLPFFLLGE